MQANQKLLAGVFFSTASLLLSYSSIGVVQGFDSLWQMHQAGCKVVIENRTSNRSFLTHQVKRQRDLLVKRSTFKIGASIPDELLLITVTVWGEARGESYEGKLAVAWVMRNTLEKKEDITKFSQEILRPGRYSFWNGRNSFRISAVRRDSDEWYDSYKAACSAYFKLESDPTNGATMYLNPIVTKEINDGELPAWYNVKRVVARIDQHEFLVE